jgi:hypothetical protein
MSRCPVLNFTILTQSYRDHARNFSRRVLGLVVPERLESQEDMTSPRKIWWVPRMSKCFHTGQL